ncbi:MAG: hypothetical protein PUG60_11845 [Lachnospiraceae bacterium]|nr:hypothetical protein [Lachnospiraceae bacterium]
MNQRVNNYSSTGNMNGRDMKSFIISGFFGSAVMEDDEFLKLLEEFDYTGEEASKALQFAAACLNYLKGGLL